MRVFISYSRKDITFAERLARDLQDAGLEVWIDYRSIRGGEYWRKAIAKGIQEADVVIVCISTDSIASEWVRREVFWAQNTDKLLIPVVIEDCGDLMSQYDETRRLSDIQIIRFMDGYERGLQELRLVLPTPAAAAPAAQPVDPASIPSPFKGLEAFQQTDAPYFRGRAELVDKCLNHLKSAHGPRFLGVIGASGSGKSSLVRAGVLPAMHADPLTQDWLVAIFTPESHPVEALASRLLPLLGEGRLLPEVVDLLEKSPRSLHQIVESLLINAPLTRQVVLVIDQFEEVFTLATARERRLFIDLVKTAAAEKDGRTTVIATLRMDFFERLGNESPDLAALFADETAVIVAPMTRANLRRSIEEPAHAVGLVYDDGLVDTLLDDVGDRPGSLPLLEYALQRLYERREGQRLTNAAYVTMGGVQKALASHAEAIYADLSPDEQDIVRHLFVNLVEFGAEDIPMRKRVNRGDLRFPGFQDDAVQAVIDRLAEKETRLLVATRDVKRDTIDGSPVWLEVSHEALFNAWDRCKDWVSQNKDILQEARDLLAASETWQRAGCSSDYLWPRGRLDAVRTWRKDAESLGRINTLQRDFLAAGELAQQKWINRLLLAGIVVSVVLAGAIIAWLYQRQLTAVAYQATFEQLQSSTINTKDPDANREVCFYGSVAGLVDLVYPTCERAVEVAPPNLQGYFRDTRGIARALRGDFSGAVQDLQAAYDYFCTDKDRCSRFGEKRLAWIKSLKAGKNPFEAQTLSAIVVERS